MFAINRVQPSGCAPVHRLRRVADKVYSRKEDATAGTRFDATETTNRFLLMVVEYLSRPAHTSSHYQAMGYRVRVSHQQSAAKPVIGGCIVQRIVHEATRDLFSIAPIRAVNSLVGIDIVIDSKAPNGVSQQWNK